MTDEELAEEWWNNWAVKDWNDLQEGKKLFIQAFLAGLKISKPQLHDLEKDPNDLPKDNDEKLCFYGKRKLSARYDSERGCWITYFNSLEYVIPSSVIIAWCEIPTFNKE